jgi:hypothetical protein
LWSAFPPEDEGFTGRLGYEAAASRDPWSSTIGSSATSIDPNEASTGERSLRTGYVER